MRDLAATLAHPCARVAMLLLASSCMPSDFDSVERTRDLRPITDCDAGDAAACPMTGDASIPEDAGVLEDASVPADAALDAETPRDAAMPDGGSCSTVCKAGETMSETGKCGPCSTGTRMRTRRCRSDGCGYDAFGDWSTCVGVTAPCAPNDTTACANGDECGHRVCTNECTWGPCVPREANGCLRIGPGHTEPGTNFECCGERRWHFCVPGCRWSDMCNPCTPENCPC